MWCLVLNIVVLNVLRFSFQWFSYFWNKQPNLEPLEKKLPWGFTYVYQLSWDAAEL